MFLRFGNRKTNKNIQKSLCKQAGKCYRIVRRRNNEQKNKKNKHRC